MTYYTLSGSGKVIYGNSLVLNFDNFNKILDKNPDEVIIHKIEFLIHLSKAEELLEFEQENRKINIYKKPGRSNSYCDIIFENGKHDWFKLKLLLASLTNLEVQDLKIYVPTDYEVKFR